MRCVYDRFCAIWSTLHPEQAAADAIDAHLHSERVDPETRGQRHPYAPFDELPDGTFVLDDGAPFLVLGAELVRWTPSGYTERRARQSRGTADVVTPPSLVAVLQARWHGAVQLLHPSTAVER